MSAKHRRAANREREAAEILGTKRVVGRPRYQRGADTLPVRLANGMTIQPEVKTRDELPKWMLEALEQAEGYLPGAIPLVALSQTGGEPMALLRLKDFARIAGLRAQVVHEQLVIGKVE